MRYPIVIHKDLDSDYGVTVPDLPGCFSAGETFDEAMTMAVEAIECHLEGMLIDNEPLLLPTTIENHVENPDFSDGIWAVVDVDLARLSGQAKRVNITVPERILTMIDTYATAQGATRSDFIAEATLEYIANRPVNTP